MALLAATHAVIGLSAMPSRRGTASPRLSPLAADLVDRVASTDLVMCPTPGCGTPLKPGKLAAHLEFKCRVLLEQQQLHASGYYRPGCNTGADEMPGDEPSGSSGRSPLTPAVAVELEARLRDAHEAEMGAALVHAPPRLSPPAAAAVGKKAAERERQRVQRAAIAAQLGALGVLGQGHVLIELGAGNGELSLAIAEARAPGGFI